MTLKIYGSSGSGNCLKTKWVAGLLGVDHEWIEFPKVRGGTRTPEFLAINPVGQVPVAVFPDGRPLAQSNAIILHLAEGSHLIPQDSYGRARMFEWLFWEQYSHEPNVSVPRAMLKFRGQTLADIDPAMIERGHVCFTRMELQLKQTPYLVGSALTLADIALVAYTRVAHEGSYDLSAYPALNAWIARVEGDLGLPSAREAA
jgi:glutathione S-transferase